MSPLLSVFYVFFMSSLPAFFFFWKMQNFEQLLIDLPIHTLEAWLLLAG